MIGFICLSYKKGEKIQHRGIDKRVKSVKLERRRENGIIPGDGEYEELERDIWMDGWMDGWMIDR